VTLLLLVMMTEPTATTTCPLNGLNVDRTSGLASGSEFPVGTTTITYTATDACGGLELCSFDIVVEETPLDFSLTCADNIDYRNSNSRTS